MRYAATLKTLGMATALVLSPLIFAGEAYELSGRTADNKPAIDYQIGETIHFTITPSGPVPTEGAMLHWQCSGDDGQTTGGKALPDQPLIIAAKLECPGFIRVHAELRDRDGQLVRVNGQEIVFDGGAGAAIDRIRPFPEPKDFDAFWARQKQRLAAVPVKIRMTKIKTDGKFDTYAVSVDCAGPRPVTGYLTMPCHAQPGTLAAEAHYDGYGFFRTGPHAGKPGTISLTVNAHGYDLEQDDEYYRKFGQSIQDHGQIYAFSPQENADPEQAYFNGMALRVMRSLEFLQSLPQWDGKHLKVRGESQGGLQSLWAAGLDNNVTECVIGIPWCCDIGGQTPGRIGSTFAPAPAAGLGYYSGAYHAARIGKQCRVDITRAGLGDGLCPASGVAAMYNNLSCHAQIGWCQGSTHTFVPKNPEFFRREKDQKALGKQ